MNLLGGAKTVEMADAIAMSETTRSNNVPEMAEDSNVAEMAETIEKEKEEINEKEVPQNKAKAMCEQISSHCIPRLRTFCFGETTFYHVLL